MRLTEDGWNIRNAGKVALAYAVDSRWRNRSEFINGLDEIITYEWHVRGRELVWVLWQPELECDDDGLMV